MRDTYTVYIIGLYHYILLTLLWAAVLLTRIVRYEYAGSINIGQYCLFQFARIVCMSHSETAFAAMQGDLAKV